MAGFCVAPCFSLESGKWGWEQPCLGPKSGCSTPVALRSSSFWNPFALQPHTCPWAPYLPSIYLLHTYLHKCSHVCWLFDFAGSIHEDQFCLNFMRSSLFDFSFIAFGHPPPLFFKFFTKLSILKLKNKNDSSIFLWVLSWLQFYSSCCPKPPVGFSKFALWGIGTASAPLRSLGRCIVAHIFGKISTSPPGLGSSKRCHEGCMERLSPSQQPSLVENDGP